MGAGPPGAAAEERITRLHWPASPSYRWIADPADVTLEAFQQMLKTRPVLVHPGRPTGRTLVNPVAVIPKQGSPIPYLTPSSPNLFRHARFTF